MDAVEMLKEKARLTNGCKIYCTACRLGPTLNGRDVNCTDLQQEHPETYVKIIEDWSKDCPKQTYLSKLLEVFPDAVLDRNETPLNICPSMLGLEDIPDCMSVECKDCWNQSIETEE